MIIRGRTARSPSSPRLPMDNLAEARRVRPMADRTRKNRREPRKKRHSSRVRCFILVCGTSSLRHGGRIRSCSRDGRIMKASQAILSLRNGSIADDGVCPWSWFSSVQAATHNNYGDRTRTAHHSGWDISLWFAVSSPLLGILVALLALAISSR